MYIHVISLYSAWPLPALHGLTLPFLAHVASLLGECWLPAGQDPCPVTHIRCGAMREGNGSFH